MKQKEFHCLNMSCRERKSVCCGAKPQNNPIPKSKILFICKCGKEFVSEKCDAMERNYEAEIAYENRDWRKEFDEKYYASYRFGNERVPKYEMNGAMMENLKEFIETLLIKILAEMESAEDARACRHILKDYLLHENKI